MADDGNPHSGARVETLEGPYALVRGRHGVFVAYQNDIYIGRSLITYGEFSEHECQLLCRLVSPGDDIVDVGANIGALTIPLARRVGPTGRVVAVEPHPRHLRLLEANLALNGLADVEIARGACGAAAGEACIDAFDPALPGNFGGSTLCADSAGVRVRVDPLDALVRLDNLRLIKIDAEGSEEEILDGAVETLERHRPCIYLESDRRDRTPSLLSRLAALDYDTWWHLPPLFNADNYFAHPRNLFPRIVSVNVLALPRESAIRLEGFRAARPEEPHPLDEPEHSGPT